MRELFKKLRKYEIRIRKAVNSQMQGDFHSVFKGSGLEFDDVRPYQYGDDVRTIDWNVSAKGHGTFVKTFREDKEQNVYFLVDVSASQEIGIEGKQKVDIAKEIAGVLTLSAIKEGSQVGMICYSDQRELYIKNGKGQKHGYNIINRLFNLRAVSPRTNLDKALSYLLGMLKRRSVVFLISDFVDEGFEPHLKALARKHDLVVIHMKDRLETDLPMLGIVPLRDKETGKVRWVNTSSSAFKSKYRQTNRGQSENLRDLCKRNQADYVLIDTQEDFIPGLMKLFTLRNRTKKKA
ncbi:hypothetical protein GCM10011506_34030 [Marivirga lumbricoides]|uniref:VWFA domain-containing protein n=2 Tax=Marivirga lumbricoides TaxID=1046115 RepID=A0ABQ1MS09_9BACT|nr:hypothetical protein GCM10011506_34030 [Marivirga lumbricoides]